MARPSSKAREEERTIVFVDESGFYPLPFVARTYAPGGQPPVLRAPLTHDHLSVIGAVTRDGRLFTHRQRESVRGPAVVAFLRQLLRQVRGKLLVIWDGAPIHHCQPVKDFLTGCAAKRLQLDQLPGYAPELNPAEGIRNQLKRSDLESTQAQRTEEPVLPGPGRVGLGARAGDSSAAAPVSPAARLLRPVRLCLGANAEMSKGNYGVDTYMGRYSPSV